MSRGRRRDGDPERFAFPRPMKGSAQPDFSFAGLKTAVRQAATAAAPLSRQGRRRHLRLVPGGGIGCAGRSRRPEPGALPRRISRHRDAGAGRGGRRRGQPRRSAQRSRRSAGSSGFRFVAPPHELCTDNAAMIAWAGIERIARRARRRRRLRLRAALALAARRGVGAGRRLRAAGSQGMRFSRRGARRWRVGYRARHADAPRRPRCAALGARCRDGRGDQAGRESALSAGRDDRRRHRRDDRSAPRRSTAPTACSR